jgi:hypothetical protein
VRGSQGSALVPYANLCGSHPFLKHVNAGGLAGITHNDGCAQDRAQPSRHIQYSMVQHSTAQTVQYSTVQCSTVVGWEQPSHDEAVG